MRIASGAASISTPKTSSVRISKPDMETTLAIAAAGCVSYPLQFDLPADQHHSESSALRFSLRAQGALRPEPATCLLSVLQQAPQRQSCTPSTLHLGALSLRELRQGMPWMLARVRCLSSNLNHVTPVGIPIRTRSQGALRAESRARVLPTVRNAFPFRGGALHALRAVAPLLRPLRQGALSLHLSFA